MYGEYGRVPILKKRFKCSVYAFPFILENKDKKDKPVKNPGIASRFTLTPEDVVKKLIHALESPKPKIRYPITLLTYAVKILKRFLPDALMDAILGRQNGKA